MNKKVLILALAAAMFALPISAAYATTPVDVNFQRTMIDSSIVGRRAGESANLILDIAAIHVFAGDIAGDGAADARWVYHNFPNGPVNIHAVETLSSVTVMGIPKSGTLTIRLDFRRIEGTMEGTWVIIGGTDELAKLHGQGTISGPIGAASYSGKIHFDP